MIARLFVCVLAISCGSSQRTLGRTFAAPGGPIFTIVHEKSSVSTSGGPTTRSSTGDHELGWSGGSSGTRIDRSWVIATDPMTGARTQLGSVTHVGASGGLEPFYWDAGRKIFWVVVEPSKRIVGLVAGGVVFPGDDRARKVTGNATRDADVYSDRGARQLLPAPFAHSDQSIWNAVDGTSIEVDAPGDSKWYYDRPLLRAVKLPALDDTEVTVTTIDWSRRSVETRRWSPWVDPSEGVRRAIAVTADGRHVVQLLERDDRLAMRITTIDGVTSRMVVLDAAYRPARSREFTLVPFFDDAIIVGYDGGFGGCLRGHSARIASGDVVSIPEATCVSHTQRAVLPQIGVGHSAVIDAKGALKPLGEVYFANRTAPSTLVFARNKHDKSPPPSAADDPALEWVRLDLKTGDSRVVTLGEAQPKVLDWGQGVDAFVPFVEVTVVTTPRTDKRVRVPSWTGGPPIELPKPVLGKSQGVELNGAGD